MRKPGPKGVPLSELIFWETLWYSVFLGLKGREPSEAEKFARRETAIELWEQLRDLKRSLREKFDGSWEARWVTGQIKTEASFITDRKKAEPDVWSALVSAKTADQVRHACSQSKRWLNPAWGGRPYVQLLSNSADKFVKAKRDRFYPRSARPSSDKSRIIFFARVMAGIECGIAPSTAVDRLRKMKHGDECPCVHCNVRRENRMYSIVYGDLHEPTKDDE